MKLLLATAYLGPVQYYTHLCAAASVQIEQHEHYRKQTWRNRCRIAGPNGVQDLVVPVKKYANHTPVKDILIAYDEPWQRLHWRSIVAAYANSPFFEHYEALLRPYFEEKKFTRLLDRNQSLLELSLRLLKLSPEISLTEIFEPEKENDLRTLISPKKNFQDDPSFRAQRYPQVFEERYGFQANLSILDLLCCAGPGSAKVLQTGS